MPLYEYECPLCNTIFSRVLPMSQADDPQYCHNPECSNTERCRKIFRVGHGGIRTSTPTWLKGMSAHFGTPINSVEDVRKYYRDNPNIKPKDYHPALSSCIGDCERPLPVKEQKSRRKKAALEGLRKMRRIEVSTKTGKA